MVEMIVFSDIVRQGVPNRVGGERRVCRVYLQSADIRKDVETERDIFKKERIRSQCTYLSRAYGREATI